MTKPANLIFEVDWAVIWVKAIYHMQDAGTTATGFSGLPDGKSNKVQTKSTWHQQTIERDTNKKQHPKDNLHPGFKQGRISNYFKKILKT